MVRKTKQEAQETREKLLDAAETLFHHQGVSHTSLQQIAQEAGLTRGAVYWHFKDKGELFDAMMRRATMPLEEGVSKHNELPVSPVTLTELRWRLVNVFWTTMHNERTRRVFEIAMQKVEYTGELSALKERKLEARRVWRDQNRAAFDQAVRNGQLPATLDTQVAAIALVSLVDGLLHNWIADPTAFDLMKVGRQAVEGALTSMGRATGTQLLPPMTQDELARLGQQGVCQQGKTGCEPD
ncbi:MAG TPA: TetR family transcriptional regulator [Burkholderiaceae bacterium]|jgi:TetR/AcrR family acrAB operon transcriptional repressor